MIDGSVFAGCTELRSISIPEGITIIDTGTFSGCSKLAEVTLPESLTTISRGAFLNTGLTCINIPEAVTTIGSRAFDNCAELTGLNIPDGVTSIADDAFSDCSKLVITCNCDSYAKQYTENKNIPVNVTHQWLSPEYQWADDNTTVTAKHLCSKDDSHEETETVTVSRTVTKDATCFEKGEMTLTSDAFSIASFAVQSKTEDIAPGHHWQEPIYTWTDSSVTGKRICSRDSSHIEQETAAIDSVEHFEPTCQEEGKTVYTSKEFSNSAFAKQVRTEVTAGRTPHTIEILPAVEETCTADGLTEGSKCSVCHEILVQQETIPAHHLPVVDEQAVEPTCTEEGFTESSHCSKCGAVLQERTAIPVIPHTEAVDPSVLPTCTETGLTEGKHCSVCGTVLLARRVIPATGHTVATDEGYPATCTQAGLSDGRHCEVCGTILADREVIPATGHRTVVDEGYPATCTQTGLTEGKHCAVCDIVLLEQEEIPATGHHIVTDEGYPATCAETGLTEGKYCSVCGEVVKAQTIIQRLEHTLVTDPYVAPTANSTGLTEGSHCSVCGTVIIRQAVIPRNAFVSGDASKANFLKLPSSLTTVATETFYNNGFIKKVEIPASVASIESKAFAESTVQEIILPGHLGIGDIASDAFANSRLHTVYTDKGSDA